MFASCGYIFTKINNYELINSHVRNQKCHSMDLSINRDPFDWAPMNPGLMMTGNFLLIIGHAVVSILHSITGCIFTEAAWKRLISGPILAMMRTIMWTGYVEVLLAFGTYWGGYLNDNTNLLIQEVLEWYMLLSFIALLALKAIIIFLMRPSNSDLLAEKISTQTSYELSIRGKGAEYALNT